MKISSKPKETSTTVEEKSGESFLEKVKTKFTVKRVIIVVLICAILVFAIPKFFGKEKNVQKTAQSYSEFVASKGSITETIEQSGVVEPYERYEITALVKGEIIASPFEEGTFVNEGDTLYQIDDEDVQLTIERAQNNIEKAQIALSEINEDIANLSIYAETSGKLTDFSLEKGDNVNGGIIGRIVNDQTISLDIPFSSDDFSKISVGDSVTLKSAMYMGYTFEGKVTHKYNATTGSGADGSVLKNIEVTFDVGGVLADGTTFAATVHTYSGDVNSAGSGVADEGVVIDVKAEVPGTVARVNVKNGDYVEKGQLLVVLTNDSLVNSRKNSELSLRDSQLSLESSLKNLENYNITAPISGTVITKNAKAGDKIDSSTGQSVMMVVADMSKMKFTISVDELDISDIKLGQTAVVDADALPNELLEAKVTSIASEGVSTGNGVTTYQIELTIDNPGNLKSGMNVNANILINEAHDVIMIPEDALMGIRGSKASVLVKTDKQVPEKDGEQPKDGGAPEQSSQNKQGVKGLQDNSKNGEQQRPQGQSGANPVNAQTRPNAGKNANIPEGCEIRQVEIGVSDGQFIEIVSGLSEGEIVMYVPVTASSGDDFSRMMSGMMSGGMRGGMGGGMPSGGMGGYRGGMTGGR